MLAAFFPWIQHTPDLSVYGFNIQVDAQTSSGIQGVVGIISLILFAVVAGIALIGKKEKMIAKGFPKMGILVISGLIFLGILIILAACMVTDTLEAKFGVYLTLIISVLTALAPYLFKADGTVAVPKIEEVADDIEDSADIVEDEIEEIAEKVEDKFEETFDNDTSTPLSASDEKKEEKNDKAPEA
jgi:hypothetical protein